MKGNKGFTAGPQEQPRFRLLGVLGSPLFCFVGKTVLESSSPSISCGLSVLHPLPLILNPPNILWYRSTGGYLMLGGTGGVRG